jgi:uncharacterized membrane protein
LGEVNIRCTKPGLILQPEREIMYTWFLTIAGIALIVHAIVLVFLTHDSTFIIIGVMGGFLVLVDVDIRRYLHKSENRS